MLAVTPASYNYVHGGAKAALFASIVGPIFLTTLLMFVSGLTLQERPGAKKRYEKGEGWNEYPLPTSPLQEDACDHQANLVPRVPDLCVRSGKARRPGSCAEECRGRTELNASQLDNVTMVCDV
jgi:hypothetical protein